MPALNPFSHAFGIDLGDRTFRLVQTIRRKRTGDFKLVAWSEVDVPEGVIVHGEIKDMERASEYLSRLVRGAHGRLRGSSVVASLPEARTFIKIIDLPEKLEEEKLQAVLLEEIEQNIPLPRNEIYYDSQEVPATDDAAPSDHAHDDAASSGSKERARSIILGAAPKTLVDDYARMLESAGLAPLALEMEAMAVARATVPDGSGTSEPVGILDVGATRSYLVIFDAGVIQMSISIPISGEEITQAVVDALAVEKPQAEHLKRECGLDATKCEGKVWNALSPLIDDMSTKIKNAVRFYKIGFPHGKKIEKILLCGGGAQLAELDAILSRRLTIRVQKADVLVNLAKRLPSSFPTDRALSFATALGVAMSAADRHEEFRKFSV